MGRRTKRYLHQQLKEALAEFDQKEIQVICWDGSTLAGLAHTKSGEGMEISDKNLAWYNHKKHTHFVHLSDIKEVLVDEISNW